LAIYDETCQPIRHSVGIN